MIDSMNPRILASNIRELFKKVSSITPGTDVEGNPSGSGYNTLLTKIKIGTHKYKLPSDVEANPEGSATGVLEKLGIGTGIFSIIGLKDYSTDEVDLGIKWIDGNEIYRKTFNLDEALVISRENYTDVNSVIEIADAVSFINAFSLSTAGNYQGILLCERDSSTQHITMQSVRNGSGTINAKVITITYTKAATP